MFPGHFAVTLAAWHAVPAKTFNTLVLPAQLASLAWPELSHAGVRGWAP